MQVVFAYAARSDIQDILAFYRSSSASAGEFGALIQTAGDHLSHFPYTGHRRRDLTQANVCFWFADPYLLVFEVGNDMLSIVAVLHSSRHVSKILLKRFKRPRP
jgi:plasmid stabilization system protein ParE